jgi:hypothetical protein
MTPCRRINDGGGCDRLVETDPPRSDYAAQSTTASIKV